MDPQKKAELQTKLQSAGGDVLLKVRKALDDAGLDSIHIGSLQLYLKHPPVQCPPDQEPVYELVMLDDGTAVYRWVCKPL